MEVVDECLLLRKCNSHALPLGWAFVGVGAALLCRDFLTRSIGRELTVASYLQLVRLTLPGAEGLHGVMFVACREDNYDGAKLV